MPISSQKWAGLGEYVEQLHRDGLKFVPIIDPAIQVSDGRKYKMWNKKIIRYSKNEP